MDNVIYRHSLLWSSSSLSRLFTSHHNCPSREYRIIFLTVPSLSPPAFSLPSHAITGQCYTRVSMSCHECHTHAHREQSTHMPGLQKKRRKKGAAIPDSMTRTEGWSGTRGVRATISGIYFPASSNTDINNEYNCILSLRVTSCKRQTLFLYQVNKKERRSSDLCLSRFNSPGKQGNVSQSRFSFVLASLIHAFVSLSLHPLIH